MQVSISSKTMPPGQTLRKRLEGSKTPPPETITVYKNPPLGTEQGVKNPHPRDLKLENFTNISINSDTISNEKLCGLDK